MSEYILTSSGELYHYGVPGMKWGHRKRSYTDPSTGKTYRRHTVRDVNRASQNVAFETKRSLRGQGLNAYQGFSRVKKAVKKNALDMKAESKKAKELAKAEKKTGKESGLSDKTKTNLKIGAAVVGTALASYGIYKVSNAIKKKDFKRRMDGGMKYLEHMKDKGRSGFGIGMEELRSTMNDGMNSTVSSIVKQTISNNSVNGRVDWRGVAKRLNPLGD